MKFLFEAIKTSLDSGVFEGFWSVILAVRATDSSGSVFFPAVLSLLYLVAFVAKVFLFLTAE